MNKKTDIRESSMERQIVKRIVKQNKLREYKLSEVIDTSLITYDYGRKYFDSKYIYIDRLGSGVQAVVNLYNIKNSA
jgi:hypothetical protein